MPFSSVSSTINAKPAIFPPIFSINFPEASAVPPVANESSQIKTRSPLEIEIF